MSWEFQREVGEDTGFVHAAGDLVAGREVVAVDERSGEVRLADGSVAELKGSIDEGSNHSNFSYQSSVKILSKFTKCDVGKFQHFLKYRRNSDKISSKSVQNQ